MYYSVTQVLTEHEPLRKVRPISSALCVLCNCVGVAVSYKINSLFDWRSADYIQSGVVAGVALLSLMLPESYVWLLLKGLLF